ncbi:hypothetical protein BDCR2A_01006 [Borrelia duttonii CR2A]|uniref:Uncharacterized protein n=3 Tax=Borrelia duttonii TaxID=40834 RepID=W6TXD1_9SPIR|nr:uncharacterized conserved protein [Borrelia duttonii Ly]ACH93750.1 uncharacterized conserved protein [Borrelia duttonii Ly]ETZ17776.1 hypothetical protein BDCR2A_01306 [Borrelia duttonii CR2A]ETZ19033.1 hypothetical protein BDCR2A_01006 [Borrelia duttonii CR2A]
MVFMTLKNLFKKLTFKNALGAIKDISIVIKHKFVKIKVYSLVGVAGTGKSFRSHLIADKYSIPLIIDDGVLIKNMKIIAGTSAKFENNVFDAIRRSIFEDDVHRNEIVEALRKENFNKILILGTSVRMIDKITSRLFLPNSSKIIYITDISTKKEIEKAKISRQMGEHVVPAAAFEITSIKPNLLLDSIRVFFKRKGFLSKKRNYIRSIVKPNFHDEGGILSVSKNAVRQVIEHCVSEYNKDYIVYNLKIKKSHGSYYFKLFLDIPLGSNLLDDAEMLREYIINNVLKYTIINISGIDVIIHKFYEQKGNLDK